MSGTRKIEKFELDSVGKPREGAPKDVPVVDLPARPFEPRLPEPVSAIPDVAFREPIVEKETQPPRVEAEPPPNKGNGPVTPGAAWQPGEFVPPQAPEPAPDSSAPSQDPDALRTRLARKFVSLAESFGEAFREFAIGAGSYAVELTMPPGMSTGGGKQALQHIRLRPRRQGYPVLVGGTVNQVERRAELRDFDHLSVVNEVRFRQPLDVSQQEWEQFLRKAEVVLNAAGIQSMRTPPTRDLLEQRRNLGRISKRALAILGVVLFLAALVLWRVIVVVTSQP